MNALNTRNFNLPLVLMVMAGVTASLLILYPMGFLGYGSLRSALPGEPGSFTLDNFINAFTAHKLGSALVNTLILMVGTTLLACPLGVLLVWITTRTDTPYRQVLEIMNIFPFLLSPYVAAVAWSLLLSPRVGLLNNLIVNMFGLEKAPVDIYSIGGTIWVLMLYYIPYMYLFVLGSFKTMDPTMEEAARACGSSLLRTTLKVTIPLALPAILSGVILVFIHSGGMLGVPIHLMNPTGDYVLTTTIIRFTQIYPQQYGAAASVSVLLLLVTSGCIYLQRRLLANKQYTTVTGKAFRPRLIRLGKLRWVAFGFNLLYLFIAIVLPYGTLILVSFLSYWAGEVSPELLTLDNYRFALFEDEATINSIGNSLLLSVVGSFICLVLTMLIAYLVNRTKVKGRGFFDYITMLPVGIPGMVIAVGLLWAWIRMPLPLYGTIWLIMIAFITRYMPYGMRTFSNTLVQLGPELEESARICGSSWFASFHKILIPLLKSGFMSGWILLFILFMRELSTALVLWSSGNEVISVQLYQLARDGEFPQVAALSIIHALIIIGGIIIFKLIVKEQFSEKLGK